MNIEGGGPNGAGSGGSGGGGVGTAPFTTAIDGPKIIATNYSFTFNVPADGIYRVDTYVNVQTASGGNSLVLTESLTWNDGIPSNDGNLQIGPGLSPNDGFIDTAGGMFPVKAGSTIVHTVVISGSGTLTYNVMTVITKVA